MRYVDELIRIGFFTKDKSYVWGVPINEEYVLEYKIDDVQNYHRNTFYVFGFACVECPSINKLKDFIVTFAMFKRIA